MRDIRRTNKRLLIILTGILCLMGIGYSAFSSNLKISGTSSVSSSWDIAITGISDAKVEGLAEETHTPTWDRLTASMEADLYQKGDSVSYDVTIENRGTLDATLEDISQNVKSTNEAVRIMFTGYTKGQVLKSKSSQVVTVKIEYNPDFDGNAEEGSGEVSVTFNYTQYEGSTNTSGDTSAPQGKYLVTYNCDYNGGSDTPSILHNQYLSSGSAIDLTPQCTKAGYTFLGWNAKSDATDTISSLNITSNNITLYGIYKKPSITYKVTYAKGSNVSAISKSSDTCTIPEVYNNNTQASSCSVVLPTITPNTGYTSLGFDTLENSTTGVTGSYALNSNITLYANAKVNSYVINYMSNGGNGTMSNQSITYGSSVTIAKNTYVKTGYTFSGWTTNSDGTDDGYGWTDWSGTWEYVNGQYGISSGKLTLYARWTANELIFSDQIISKAFSTSNQTASITDASNGTGTYTYTKTSETNSSGISTNYISISENTITINANTPVDTYTYKITAKDSNSEKTKTATYKITISRAKTATTGSCNSLTYNGTSRTLASGGTNVSYSNNSRTDAGSQTVTINANDNYAFSDGTTSKTLSCSIGKASGWVNLSATSGSTTYGTSSTSFTISGSHGGTLSVSDNNSTATSSISGSTVTIGNLNSINAGTTITVTVTSAATTNYNAASKIYTLTISRAKTATTGSCNSLTYNGTSRTLASGGTNVSYSNNSRTDAGSQTVTINANNNYAFSDGTTSKTLSCSIGKASGWVNLSATSGSTTYGTSSTSFTISGSHGGTLSVSDNNSTATSSISGSTVTIGNLNSINAGTTITVTVTSAATTNYNAASKNFSLAIGKTNGWVNLSTTSGSTTYGTSSKTFTVNSSHGGTLSVSDNNSTATSSISGSTVTLGRLGSINAGTSITVTVTSAATTNYYSASKTYTHSITKANSSFSLSSTSGRVFAVGCVGIGTPYDVSLISSVVGSGSFSVSSSNSTYVASINTSGSTRKVQAYSNATTSTKLSQTATLTVTQAANTNYKASSKTISLSAKTSGNASNLFLSKHSVTLSVNGTQQVTATKCGSTGNITARNYIYEADGGTYSEDSIARCWTTYTGTINIRGLAKGTTTCYFDLAADSHFGKASSSVKVTVQ